MKNRSILIAFALAVGLCTSLGAVAQEDMVSKCCQKEPGQAKASGGDCCQTGDKDAQFTKSCCALNLEDTATAAPDANVQAAQGGRQGRGPQGGRGGGGQGRGGMGGMGVMKNAHTLVFNHGSLKREITDIPGGVRTVSTTTDPNLLAVLRKHPKEMDAHLKKGGHVRMWDPLFAELGKHHDKIKMEFKDVENGIEVTSTSEDPEVAKLIRAHARKVSEFVARGRAAMHESTPLPEDYKPE